MNCVNKNDKEVQRLMKNANVNEARLTIALNSLANREAILKSGVKLAPDFSNLNQVAAQDVKKELSFLEANKDTFVKDIASATDKLRRKLNLNLKILNNKLIARMLDKNSSKEKLQQFEALQKKKDDLLADIKHLEETMDDSTMLIVSSKQLDKVENLLNKDDISLDELNFISSTLQIFNNFHVNYIPKSLVKTVTDIVDENGEIVTIEIETETYKKAKELSARSASLYRIFIEKDKKSVFSKAQNVLSHNITREEFDKPVEDVDSFSKYVRILGNVTGSKLHQFAAVFLRAINNKSETLQQKYEKIFTEAYANITKSPLFQQYGFSLMYDKDSNGNAEYLISKYSKEFTEARRKIEKAYKKADRTKEDIANYFNFRRANYNSICLVDEIFESLNGDSVRLNTVKNQLISVYGESLGNNIYKSAYEKADNFVQGYLIAKDSLPEVELQKWIATNDPRPLHQATLTGKYIENVTDAMYKGIHTIPKARYYNPVYLEMAKDEAYFSYYNRYLSFMEDYIHMMPYDFVAQRGIRKNFIGYVQNQNSELLKKENGSKSLLNRSLKKAYSFFNTKEEVDLVEETGYEALQDAGYNLNIPIHYLTNATKVLPNGDIVTDFDSKEMDLHKIVKAMIPQVSKYQMQQQALPVIEQIIRVAEEISEDNSADGEQTKQTLANTKEMLKYEINAVLGRKNEKPEGTVKNLKLMTPEEKQEIEYLEKGKADKLAEIKASTMKEEDKAKAIDAVTKQYDAQIQNRLKYFSAGQTFRSIIKYYVIKTLGFGTSFIFDAFNSTANVLLESGGNEHYNLKDYFTGLTSYWSKKAEKIRYIYTLTANTEYGEGHSTGFEKWALFLNEGNDKLQKYAVLEAMMKKETLITKEGNSISLWEAYNEDGSWKSELFDDETNEAWNPNSNLYDLEDRNQFYRFKDKVEGMFMKTFGAYSDKFYLMGKSTTLGKALFLFKTWLPEAFATRFENKRYDPFMDKDIKGRWRSLAHVFMENGFVDTAKALFTGNTEGLHLIDGSLDAANMKKNMIEMYSLIVLFVTITALTKAFGDDDDDESEHLAFYAFLNMAGRLQQDLTYFVNPAEAHKLVENAIPVLKLYKDFQQLGGAMVKTIEGKPTYQSGLFADWSRVGKESAEFLPITNGALKFYKIFNSDMTEGK